MVIVPSVLRTPRGQSSGQPPEQSDPSLTSTAAISVPIEECEPVHVIDMNTASEEILSAIPEIGPELAPRVIVERMNRRGFGSIEEFVEAFHFSRYQLEVLEPLVYFSKRNLPGAPDTHKLLREISVMRARAGFQAPPP